MPISSLRSPRAALVALGIAVVGVAVAFAACKSDRSCGALERCALGESCVGGVCERPCTRDEDCIGEGDTCVAAICTPPPDEGGGDEATDGGDEGGGDEATDGGDEGGGDEVDGGDTVDEGDGGDAVTGDADAGDEATDGGATDTGDAGTTDGGCNRDAGTDAGCP